MEKAKIRTAAKGICVHCGDLIPAGAHFNVKTCSPECRTAKINAAARAKYNPDSRRTTCVVRLAKASKADRPPPPKPAPGCGCGVCRECQLFAALWSSFRIWRKRALALDQ